MNQIVDYIREVLGVESVILNDRPLGIEQNQSGSPERISEKLGVDAQMQILDFVGTAWPKKNQSDKVCSVLFLNLVRNSSDSILQSENHDLIFKMIAAMKLEAGTYSVAETYWSEESQRELMIQKIRNDFNVHVLIAFSREPQRQAPRVVGEITLIETFSAAILREKEELKRQAWEDLKLVLKLLK